MNKDLEIVEWRVCLGRSLEPVDLTYLVYILSNNSSCDSMPPYDMKLWFICYLLATQVPFPFLNSTAVSFWSSPSPLLGSFGGTGNPVPVFHERSQNDLVFLLYYPNKTEEQWPHDVRSTSLHSVLDLA